MADQEAVPPASQAVATAAQLTLNSLSALTLLEDTMNADTSSISGPRVFVGARSTLGRVRWLEASESHE